MTIYAKYFQNFKSKNCTKSVMCIWICLLLCLNYQVLAGTTSKARIRRTIVNVDLTVLTSETTWTVTCVVTNIVIAGCSTMARIAITLIDLNITIISPQARIAVAYISFLLINAHAVRTAQSTNTKVNIQLAVTSSESS